MKKMFVLLLIVVAVASFWYKHALTPVDSRNEVRVIVSIPTGSSLSSIANILRGKDVIRSPFAFSLFVRWQGSQSKLQAGQFVLRPSMSVSDIVSMLTGGEAEEATVTIPEGFTVKDIDALLAKQGIAASGSLIVCAKTCDFSSFTFLPKVAGLAPRGGKLEGYLFPDTYFITREQYEPKFFLERLLTTFRKRVVDGKQKELTASHRSLHDIVTMASLIEEETRTADERPIVAGILWKRFDAKMGLGVDAAVRYIVDKPRGAITEKDLETDSPYNLRKYRGLPPGPIANPSLSSIEAALQPKESAYWYYLHDGDGKIHYAATNDEHNRNRALYLQ